MKFLVGFNPDGKKEAEEIEKGSEISVDGILYYVEQMSLWQKSGPGIGEAELSLSLIRVKPANRAGKRTTERRVTS